MTAGIKANSDGSAAIQVGGVDAITLTSAGAATFVQPITLTTDLAVTDGGTGASNAADARTNLGTVNDPGSNGILARTSANTTTARTITAGTGISVTNGTGAAGDPTITNSGVTSLTAGTGISLSGATGGVTITNTAASGGNYAMNAYVSPTTWSKPAGLKAVKVTVVGAGGAGGAASVPPGTPTGASAGSGGGGGGAAVLYIPAPSIPGPVGITAGPGTNSFGAFCSATAGSAGAILTASAAGGAGGTGTGGNFNIPGQQGMAITAVAGTSPSNSGSAGGNSLLGLGGAAVSAASGGTPPVRPGTGYGGGGAGSIQRGAGTTAGGTGAAGIVVVEEFY